MFKINSLRMRFCLWTVVVLIPLGLALTVMSFWILDTSSGNFDDAINDAMNEMHHTVQIRGRVLELGRDLDVYITHQDQVGQIDLLAQAESISVSLTNFVGVSTLLPNQQNLIETIVAKWKLFYRKLMKVDVDYAGNDGLNNVLARHKELEEYLNEIVVLLDQVHKIAMMEINKASREASKFDRDARVAVLSAAIAGILFALMVAIYFSRSIMTSIHSLSRGVQEYGRGNLDYRIEISGHDELSLLGVTFNNMAANLQRTHEEYKRISCHDYLTGILNRREIHNILTAEMERSSRYSRPMSVLLFDLDNFKGINDRWGHAVGDQVLVAVSRLIERELRPVDIFGRYGGEEFVVLLPETDYHRALDTAERLRMLIEEEGVELNEQDILHITSSFGVSSYPEHANSDDELLKMADYALYKAKGKGRNRVVGANEIHLQQGQEFGKLTPAGHVPRDMSILL